MVATRSSTKATTTNGHSVPLGDSSKAAETVAKSGGTSSAGNLGFCSFLIILFAVILSDGLHIAKYPPNSFKPVAVTAQALKEAGGEFVQLSRGRVHYVIRRPTFDPVGDDGQEDPAASLPPIVLIHGFSMGCRIWDPVAEDLRTRGKRTVVAFDLYGRGYSDAAYPCDLALLTGQLSELLFTLQPILGTGPYDIIGTSMGGAIAVQFANLYPDHVRKLVLVAPAGFPVHVPFTAALAKLPLIGDVFMPLLGPLSLKSHAKKGHAHPDDPDFRPVFEAMGKHLMQQTERNPGFFPALLSTLRNFPLGDMEWVFREVADKRTEQSVLVVWGDKDEVTPFRHADTVMQIFGSKAQLVVLNDCGHVDALEVPRSIQEMMQSLLSFMQQR